MPATGAIAALITKATGREPYIVGKPNPMMFRSAMNQIDAHSETTAMIGDRMDTDIIAGMEAGLHTVLVLSGITQQGRHRRLPVPAQPDPELRGGPQEPDRGGGARKRSSFRRLQAAGRFRPAAPR